MESHDSSCTTHMRKVPVPGGELYFERTGSGPALIFIHAGFADRREWAFQVAALSKNFDIIVYDQRGAGNSSIPQSDFSTAADVKALMDYLNLRKVTIVGHSIGGTIALDFALQYPESVSALVLLAPGLNGHNWSKEYLEWMQSIWSDPRPDEMTRKFLEAPFYSVCVSEPRARDKIETMTRESLEKALSWKPVEVHWFFPQAILKLADIKAPTLLMFGGKDSQDIKEIAGQIGKSNIAVKTVELADTDHMLNFEKPHEVNSLIAEFLTDGHLIVKTSFRI